MKNGLIALILIVSLGSPLFAQTERGLSAEEILLKQAGNKQDQSSLSKTFDERMRSLARISRPSTDYLLGSGDMIELTVVGIPGLDKKVFTLDGQGTISVPYLGQVELMGLKAREVESKLAKLFAASLLEDPQVTVGVKEYRSQFFYVMGAVRKPDRYPLAQSMDILDALALAGGLTDKADSKIRIYRYSQPQAPESDPWTGRDPGARVESAKAPDPSNPLEVSLPELLEGVQDNQRVPILSGDVVEVQERKERNYYVLGDIQKPGAYAMRPDESMALSQALGNAGGMLKTAAGTKVMIIRQKSEGELPEQIRVNAYAVLKGDVKDIKLLENDIVLVPGSASKTIGKNVLSGVTGVITTLLLIGTR